MANKTIRAGVIGCGKVGPFHASAYQKIENCELCAVYDVQEERARAFAKKYKQECSEIPTAIICFDTLSGSSG